MATGETPLRGDATPLAPRVAPPPLLPTRSFNLAGMRRLARRTLPGRLAGRAADAFLEARQRALGIGREIDTAAAEIPRRRVLVLGVYGAGGVAHTADAVARLRESRHDVSFALGSIGQAAAELRPQTVIEGMRAGKFANLNRLAEASEPLAADWVILIDDDIALGRRFLDRLVFCAERFRLQLAQPALSRASFGYWQINRRRAAIARQTAFVEVGPLVMLHRDAYRELAPFPVEGMGWGLDLVWAGTARRLGWRLGVIDAAPVRHELRRNASAYAHGPARAAALALLAGSEHIDAAEVENELARHTRL